MYLLVLLLCWTLAVSAEINELASFSIGIPGALLGKITPQISDDGRHLLACAEGVNDRQGACYVWSESAPGMMDWEDNAVTTIVATDGGPGDAFMTARMSVDNKHIVVCSVSVSKCYVFTESVSGSMNWQLDQYILTRQPDGLKDDIEDSLGQAGVSISESGQYISTCAPQWNFQIGQCYIWAASSPGAKDWADQEYGFVALDYYQGYGGSQMGRAGHYMSPDATILMSCQQFAMSSTGRCYTWTASGIGMEDWGGEETFYPAHAIDTYDFFGSATSGSYDNSNLLACAPNVFGASICFVFTESILGARDWYNDTAPVELRVTDDPTVSRWEMGKAGTSIQTSKDNRFITSCATGSASSGTTAEYRGRCILFTESSPGARDWGETVQASFVPSDAVIGDQFGHGKYDNKAGIYMTSDARFLFSCSSSHGNDTGKCYVFENHCHNVTGVCLHDGYCVPENGGFQCVCPAGYAGQFCELDIDECDTIGCQNGGNCTDLVADLECNCTGTGFQGIYCQVDIDECDSSPCLAGSTCHDDANEPNVFTCTCVTGFNGTLCDEDIDGCESDPCLNNGTCSDDGSTPQAFNCTCPVGWIGPMCELDSNDCASSPCVSGAMCTDEGLNQYSCRCTQVGFTGAFCEFDIDDCESNPCENEGICTDNGLIPSTFNCTCNETVYTGETCQVTVNVSTITSSSRLVSTTSSGSSSSTGVSVNDDCSSSPCLHGGVCSLLFFTKYGIWCNCNSTGYAGAYCEDELLTDPEYAIKLIVVTVPTTYFSISVTEADVVIEVITVLDTDVNQLNIVNVNRTDIEYAIFILVTGTNTSTADEVIDKILYSTEKPPSWSIQSVVVENIDDADSNDDILPTATDLRMYIVIVGLLVVIAMLVIVIVLRRARHSKLVSKYDFNIPA